MKKVLFLLLAAVATTACMKDSNSNKDSETTKQQAATVNRLTTTEEVVVPVRNGYATQVLVEDEVIAEAFTSMSVLVPNCIPSSKATDVVFNYKPLSDYPNGVELANNSKLYQVVCFEDSRTGDYDYNDLVIHVKYQTKGNRFGFGIQPIALGSTKTIGLGYELYRGTTKVGEEILTDNCRNQFFQNQEGFINTTGSTSNFYPYGASKPAGWHSILGSSTRCWNTSKFNASGVMRVEWFIVVDGTTRLYALSSNHLGESFDKEGLPLGIIITTTGLEYKQGNIPCGHDWFNYPQERTALQTVYPGLWSWLTTTSAYNYSEIFTKEIKAGIYPAADLGLYTLTSNDDLCQDKFLKN